MPVYYKDVWVSAIVSDDIDTFKRLYHKLTTDGITTCYEWSATKHTWEEVYGNRLSDLNAKGLSEHHILGAITNHRSRNILLYLAHHPLSWIDEHSFGRYLLDRMIKSRFRHVLYDILDIPMDVIHRGILEHKIKHPNTPGLYPRMRRMYHPDIFISTSI